MKGRKVIYLFLFGISITRNGNANAGLCTANYAREKAAPPGAAFCLSNQGKV
jgi:hypothetical protein